MFILACKIMVSHQTLSLISVRYLADTTVKVNKISIWIIPNSLEFRRIFNAIRSKLIIFANCILPSVPVMALSFVVKEISSYCSLKVKIPFAVCPL